MRTALALAETTAWLAAAVMCIGGAIAGWRIASLAHAADVQIAPIAQTMKLDLDESHRLILEAGLTAMEARKASAEERAMLPRLTRRTDRLLDQTTSLLGSLERTSDDVDHGQASITSSTVETLETARKTIAQLQPAIIELQVTEADLDRQVNNPAIAESLQHIDVGSAALAVSAQDVQQKVHAIVHPGWLHRIWGWSLDIAHIFNPL